MTGTLYGVGVGPGDPELLTVKAARVIADCPVVAYLTNEAGHSRAAESARHARRPSQKLIPVPMIFEQRREAAERLYDEASEQLARELDQGRDVALLCEGDPLLYGSFVYFLERLAAEYPCQVVPGITSLSAAAAAALTPISRQRERIAIVPASAGDEQLRAALQGYEVVAILKPGRSRPKVVRLLKECGRDGDAVYVENASHANELIIADMGLLEATQGPYFSLFLVTRS